jgi:hypothetical protein
MKFDVFFAIIMAIETGGHPTPRYAIGKAGEVGCVQISKICVRDVNRIIGHEEYRYEDRKCPIKSKHMMRVYLDHWGSRYERLTGKPCTPEVWARIWNGGHNGWKLYATEPYLEKFRKEKDRQMSASVVH